MRDFIFILILLTMAGLAAWHTSTASWMALSIDVVLFFFALRSWNPRRRR